MQRICLLLSGIVMLAGLYGSRVFAAMPTYEKQGQMQLIPLESEVSYLDQMLLPDLKPATTQQELIKNYCTAVLKSSSVLLTDNAVGGKFLYDAHQSMFVLSLCYSMEPLKYEEDFPYLQNQDGVYYKKYHFSGFNMPVSTGSACDINGPMTTCKLYKYVPTIFDQIINDYFNIKQASVLGVQNPDFSAPNSSLEDQVNGLLSKYFFGRLGCDINGELDGLCLYPDTMAQIKDVLQDSARLINKSKVIDYTALWAEERKIMDDEMTDRQAECGMDAGTLGPTYNILRCGLVLRDDGVDQMQAFLNTVYNELFYYRLFVTYYSMEIRNNYAIGPRSSLANKEQRQLEWVNLFEQSMLWSEDAIDVSLDMIKEMYLTYPLHLGMMLYLEDLIALRKELVKVVTPVSTLYDKLRNVQEVSN